jgi:hypothetical protein
MIETFEEGRAGRDDGASQEQGGSLGVTKKAGKEVG